MKRILSLILALIMTAALFGCAGNQPEDTSADESASDTAAADTSSSAGETTVPDTPVLAENGKAVFAITRPSDATGTTITCATSVVKKIKEVSGISPTIQDDWYREGQYDASTSEILVGFCNREESDYILTNMDYEGYAIARMGAKIVIAAHSSEQLSEAADYFNSHIELQDGKTVYTGGFIFKAAANSDYVFNAANSLKDYVIVTDISDSVLNAAATSLARSIRVCCGFTPEIKGIGTAATEKEIYLGSSGRDDFQQLGELTQGTYTIAAGDSRIIIGGKTSALISSGADYFADTYLRRYLSNTILIKKGTVDMQEYIPFTISNDITEGTDIRVMSFNVLCELWDSVAKSTMQDRNERVANIIKYYAPDVVGLQEMSDMWYSRFAKYVGTDYEFTDKNNTDGKTNFSTLAYNPKTVKVVKHGVQIFSQGNNRQLRLATWAVFEKLSDGQRFIVISTHWDLMKNTEYQLVHAKEMGELVLQLQEKYNLPIITTGDYNSYEENTPYQNYVNATGLKDAKYNAEKWTYRCSGIHSVGSVCSTNDANSIDHIFGNSKVQFLYFTVIADEYTCGASDHCPIFADIKLN